MTQLPELDHQALAFELIAQSIQDVTCPDSSDCGIPPTDEERRDSLLLLTSNRRVFFDARKDWCSMIGVDPQELRLKVIEAIEMGKEFRIKDFLPSKE